MNILITGGAGFIGAHTAYKLVQTNHNIFILDNLEKGHRKNLEVIKEKGDFTFLKADLREVDQLEKALEGLEIDLVIHFAAYLEVGLSVRKPEIFFQNNVVGTQNLLKVLLEKNLRKFIFSSSAAVYGNQDIVPIPETAAKQPESPYGLTKYLMEQILESYAQYKQLDVIALRYFNPAGSYSGLIGERHIPETHVIPRLLRGFMDESFSFGIYGDDYPTEDGTCIRDFIHIEDLVNAHIACIDLLNKEPNSGFRAFNIATGTGTSVKQLVETAEEVVGEKINYEIQPRREGDPAALVADPAKFMAATSWKAKHDIKQILTDAWLYEQKRPAKDYNANFR